jgi:hypothetical protein
MPERLLWHQCRSRFLQAPSSALLHHILEHGDVVGGGAAGWTIVLLPVDDSALEKLIPSDADAAEVEHGGDSETDADDDEDGAPVVLELVRR